MNANSFVGTWQLRSFEILDEEGRVSQPMGPDPNGFITHTADGRMSVQFSRAARPEIANADWLDASPAEVAATARDFFAYCGTYEFLDGRVSHRVEHCIMPNWIGVELVRVAEMDGDRVRLTTPPAQYGGKQSVARLVWQRI